MANKILLVAFHFPPAAMGSGHLRTLGFARYLPAHDWEPLVLTANVRAYPRTAPLASQMIPAGCEVHRAFALDVRRHLAIAGKYPGFLARPDGWASWWPDAVWKGLRLIRRHRVRAIWSTYPIMSAHRIARTLSRVSGVPWIADFRDPVAASVEATNPHSVASQQHWERRVLRDASRIVFTTPGALQACARRYPGVAAAGRLAVIGNGYDDAAFDDLPAPTEHDPVRPLTLLHSGLLYPEGRDPAAFFTALARLKDAGDLTPGGTRIVLRASGTEARYAQDLRRLGIDSIVELAAPVSNRDALLEQADADALLLFQGEPFDRQIPAKVYEYLRVGRPIFAMVGEHGDTAALLRETGGAELVRIDDADAIARSLAGFLRDVRAGQAPRVEANVVARYSRRAGAALLARMLDEVAA